MVGIMNYFVIVFRGARKTRVGFSKLTYVEIRKSMIQDNRANSI